MVYLYLDRKQLLLRHVLLIALKTFGGRPVGEGLVSGEH